MGNNKFKAAALALAITPCILFAGVGCGKKDKNDNSQPTGLSVEQQNTAYNILKTTLAGNDYINKTSNFVKSSVVNKMIIGSDWSQSGVPADKKAEVAEELDLPVESTTETSQREYGYAYHTDGTGYTWIKGESYDKDENNELLDTRSYRIERQEFVKNTNDGFKKYYYYYNYSNEDTKSIYNVDDKYVPNTYKVEALEEVNDELETISEYVKDNASLDNFKQDLKDFGQEVLDSYVDGTPVLPDTGVTTAIDITLTDGIYTLTTTINIDNMDLEGFVADLNANFTIKFDGDSIENIDSNFKLSYGVDINCKDSLGTSISGVTFDNDDHVYATLTQEMNHSVDVNNPFDATFLAQDVSEYAGTGEGGTVTNESIQQEFVFVDFENVRDSNWGYYNETVNLDNIYKFYNDNVTKTYYWDRECTQPILPTDVSPSYDTEIYVKLTLNEGCAAVQERRYVNGEYIQYYTDVHQFENGNYQLKSPTSDQTVERVFINGVEVTDFAEGINLTDEGNYVIDVYVVNVNND